MGSGRRKEFIRTRMPLWFSPKKGYSSIRQNWLGAEYGNAGYILYPLWSRIYRAYPFASARVEDFYLFFVALCIGCNIKYIPAVLANTIRSSYRKIGPEYIFVRVFVVVIDSGRYNPGIRESYAYE